MKAFVFEVFFLGFVFGYLYHQFMGRLKRPEDYWTNRFLRKGDQKSAARLVKLRPDSLDLMSGVYRSGFEDEVESAFRALLHLRASDIFCQCFFLDVEVERSARGLLELKNCDPVCLEKLFLHRRLSDELMEKAARRLLELGYTRRLTALIEGGGEKALERQRDLVLRLLETGWMKGEENSLEPARIKRFEPVDTPHGHAACSENTMANQPLLAGHGVLFFI
jgi:hypothetical protein